MFRQLITALTLVVLTSFQFAMVTTAQTSSTIDVGNLPKLNTLYLLEMPWGDRCYAIRSKMAGVRNGNKDIRLACMFDPSASGPFTGTPQIDAVAENLHDGRIYLYVNAKYGDRCYVTLEETDNATTLALACHFGDL